jgi:integrase
MPSDSSASRVPKYRRHKPTGQAVVTLDGRDIYLGRWNTKASRTEYDRLIGEWLASGRCLPYRGADGGLTVAEVALRFWRFAKTYYQKNGQPTSELDEYRQAMRPLRRLYDHTLARDFGPVALKAVRQAMLDAGLSRGVINHRICRIRRVFRWAVAEELVPPSVDHGLSAIEGLRKGRTAAREPEPVRPVPDEVVEATLPAVPEVVADMIRLQRLCGARPAEVCILRPCDVDTSGDVWLYRPAEHKTQHHDRGRAICLGPKAQDVLRRYLLRPAESYCFQPAESEKRRLVERHARRVTPLQYGNQPGTNRKRRPKRHAGDCYTTNSYRRAIHRAVAAINRRRKKEAAETGAEPELLPRWSPNQLRHTAATEIRRAFGLEAAQVALGHAQANVTQIYAERDLSLAVSIMRKIG